MVDIAPIAVPKAAAVLAASLREQILDGRIAQGQTLPNERELAVRAGLSRASVREALRILEVEGLIVTRPGRAGGAEVVRPDMSTIQRSMETFIRGQGIRLQSVLEAREAVEPQAARLAALNWTESEWVAMAESHARLLADINDLNRFLKANFDWHLAVVQASHNELLIAFIASIAQPLYAATDLRDFNSPEVRKAVGVAHGRVMEALRARDADAAFRRMGRHVGAYQASVAGRSEGDVPSARASESAASAPAGAPAKKATGKTSAKASAKTPAKSPVKSAAKTGSKRGDKTPAKAATKTARATKARA